MLLNEAGEQEVIAARWGLILFWWKKDKPPPMTINAHCEEAATKPMWRDAIRHKRCLMPAAGWYEWNENEPVKNKAVRSVHQPYYHHASDDGLLAIAGIWSTWSPPEGEPITSCALLTKDAAVPVAAIHHRMPVILAPKQWECWLSPQTSLELAYDTIALSREDFEAYAVSTEVGNARNQGAGLIDPVAPR